MKKRKFLCLAILALVILGLACLFYGFKIEPYSLSLEEYDLNNINMDDLKLVHISDLHIKADYREDRLGRIVDMINEQDPDLVFFTGDLFDNYNSYGDREQVARALDKIQARYGKFAIWGNHDYGGGAHKVYGELMEEAGFKLLKNERAFVELGDQLISIYGLDDDSLGEPVYKQTREKLDYEILLAHEQKYFAENHFKVDLTLSGHTHGGQIDLPLINELGFLKSINPSLVDSYLRGFYNTENGKLFINRGIGTTVLSARFNVRPEIAVINITRP